MLGTTFAAFSFPEIISNMALAENDNIGNYRCVSLPIPIYSILIFSYFGVGLMIYVAEGFRVFTDDVNKFQISIPLGEYPL